MENKFVKVSCPVCSSSESKTLFKLNYLRNDLYLKLNLVQPQSITLNKCAICDHHYSSHQIRQEILDKYYSEINSEYFNTTEDPIDSINYQNEKLVKIIERIKKNGSILDIGCGYGFLLNKFEKSKWDRYGIDPSKHAINFAKNKLNLNVKLGYLDKDSFVNQKFDVILCFDVLEHLNNPNNLVNLINHYLGNDGLLIMGTGNINSLNFKIAKQKWSYFGSHEHISFFNESSIKYLFNNKGLKVERIIRTSYQGNAFSNIKRLIKNFILIKLYELKLKQDIVSIPLTFDHMIVVATKQKKII